MSSHLLKFAFCLLSLFSFSGSFGQTDWKNWNGLNLNLGISKKMELGVDHLRAYDLPGFQNNFNQWGINLEYEVTKRLSGKGGVTFTQFPAAAVTTSRTWLRGTYRMPLGKKINWSNGLQVEKHSANENRFQYRLIYQTRLATRNRLEFLRIAPSVSYWLYYNIGGNALQYYDENGVPISQQSPDGLHRGRLTVNLNSKINKYVSLGVYYLNQQEFNLAGRNMNVVDPTTGKVSRPFNNYHVAGLSLSLSLDMYKKKNKNKKSKSKSKK